VIVGILQLPDLHGQARLNAWSDVHIRPLGSLRRSIRIVAASAPPPTRGYGCHYAIYLRHRRT